MHRLACTHVRMSVSYYTPTGMLDFLPTSSVMDFSSSAIKFEVQIPLFNDDIYEEMEQFTARLTLLTTGTDVLLSQSSATITIIDNDGMPL